MDGWAKALLCEARADLLVRADDDTEKAQTGERVQSFFFTKEGDEADMPVGNSGGGLHEGADGSFYPGTLEALPDGEDHEWKVVFDDGDVEPCNRDGFRRILSPQQVPPSDLHNDAAITASHVLMFVKTPESHATPCIVVGHDDEEAVYGALVAVDRAAGALASLATRRQLQRLPSAGSRVYVRASALKGGKKEGEAPVPCVCHSVVIHSVAREHATSVDEAEVEQGRIAADGSSALGELLSRSSSSAWAGLCRGHRISVEALVSREGGGDLTPRRVPLSSIRRAIPPHQCSRIVRAASGRGRGLVSDRVSLSALAGALSESGVWRSREAASAVFKAAGAPERGFVRLSEALTALDGSPEGVQGRSLIHTPRSAAASEGGENADAHADATSPTSSGLLLSAVLRRGLVRAVAKARGGGGLDRVMRVLDLDGDGILGEKEVRGALERIGAPDPSEGEMAALMSVLDGDGDGKVTRAELRRFVKEGAAVGGAGASMGEGGGSAAAPEERLLSRVRAAVLGASIRAALGTGTVLDAAAVFEGLDTDSSGRLSRSELADGLQRLGCDPQENKEEWEGLIRRLDVDGDDRLSYGELVRMLAVEEHRASLRRRWGRLGALLVEKGVDVEGVIKALGSRGTAERQEVKALLVDEWGVPLTGEEVEALLEAASDAGDGDMVDSARLCTLLLDKDDGESDGSDAEDGDAAAATPASKERRATLTTTVPKGSEGRWSQVVFVDPKDIPVPGRAARTDDLVAPHQAFSASTLPPWIPTAPGHDRTAEAGTPQWLQLPIRDCAGWRQWSAAAEALLSLAAGGSGSMPEAHAGDDDHDDHDEAAAGIPGQLARWVGIALGVDAPPLEMEALGSHGSISLPALRLALHRFASGSDTPRGMCPPPGLHATAFSRLCSALAAAGGRPGGRVRRQALARVLQDEPLRLPREEAEALCAAPFAPGIGAGYGWTESAGDDSEPDDSADGESEHKAADSDEEEDEEAEVAEDEEDDEDDEKKEASPSKPRSTEQKAPRGHRGMGAGWEELSCDAWLHAVRLAAAGIRVVGSSESRAASALASLCGPASRLPLRRFASTGTDVGPIVLFRLLQGHPLPTAVPVSSRSAQAFRWSAPSLAMLSADPAGTVALAASLGSSRAARSLCPDVGYGLDGQAARKHGTGVDGFGVGLRIVDMLPPPSASSSSSSSSSSSPAAAAAHLAAVTSRPFVSFKGKWFRKPVQPPAPIRGLGPLGSPWGRTGGAATISAIRPEGGGLLQCVIEPIAARGIPVPEGSGARSAIAARALRVLLVDGSDLASPRLLAAAPTLPAVWDREHEDEWHFSAAKHRTQRAAVDAAAASGVPLASSKALAAIRAAKSLPDTALAAPITPAVLAAAKAQRLTDDIAQPALATAMRAASDSPRTDSGTTHPMPGWSALAVRAAHPRQPLTPEARARDNGPRLLFELVLASILPEDDDADDDAAPYGLLSPEASLNLRPRSSSASSPPPARTPTVELCTAWASVALSDLAAVSGPKTLRVPLTGGAPDTPLAILPHHSLQRRSSALDKAGNIIAGHRPPTLQLQVTPSSSLKAKDLQALALLPLGGEAGAGGFIIPATAVRAAAALRTGAASAVLAGTATGLAKPPPLAVEAAASLPAGSVPAAGVSLSDPASLTEDDAVAGCMFGHMGAASCLRSSASPTASLAARDTLLAVMRMHPRSSANQNLRGVAASSLAHEFAAASLWPPSSGSPALAPLLIGSVPKDGSAPSSERVVSGLLAEGMRAANPPPTDDGSGQEPFDLASVLPC